MTPPVLLIQGNAAHIPLPDESVHCVVTSPPYYGLRQYDAAPVIFGGDPGCAHVWDEHRHDPQPHGDDGRAGALEGGAATQSATRIGEVVSGFCRRCGAWRGQLGLEPTPELYVEHLVEIFREVRRVLRSDGTLWLNLGDSYATQPRGDVDVASFTKARSDGGRGWTEKHCAALRSGYRFDKLRASCLKPKDLMLMPARVVLALQADGWWVRAVCPWTKNNAMPESVKDRPGVAHEDIYLLSKSARYFYDASAVCVPQTGNAHARGNGSTPKGRVAERGRDRANDSFQTSTANAVELPSGRNRRTSDWQRESLDAAIDAARAWLDHAVRVREMGGMHMDGDGLPLDFAVNTAPYSGAHFATFPPDLVRPMLKASTSGYGACPDCGAQWGRVLVKPDFGQQPQRKTCKSEGEQISKGENYYTSAGQAWQDWRNANPDRLAGWRPTCDCYDDRYRCEFPRARSARKRQQQDAQDSWWPRVRRRAGLDHWPVTRPIVLDPFGGTGVVGLVARQLGLRAVCMDLGAPYLRQAQERVSLGPLFDLILQPGKL